jgi:cell division protein FtsB
VTTRQSILLALGIVSIFSLLLLILFGDNGLADLSRLRSEQQRLETRNERLDRENRDIYRKIVRLDGEDPAYIEHVARKDLGMIGPNEVVFQLDSEKNGSESNDDTR